MAQIRRDRRVERSWPAADARGEEKTHACAAFNRLTESLFFIHFNGRVKKLFRFFNCVFSDFFSPDGNAGPTGFLVRGVNESFRSGVNKKKSSAEKKTIKNVLIRIAVTGRANDAV